MKYHKAYVHPLHLALKQAQARYNGLKVIDDKHTKDRDTKRDTCTTLQDAYNNKKKECDGHAIELNAAWCAFESAHNNKCQAVAAVDESIKQRYQDQADGVVEYREVRMLTCMLQSLITGSQFTSTLSKNCQSQMVLLTAPPLPNQLPEADFVEAIMKPYRAFCDSGATSQTSASLMAGTLDGSFSKLRFSKANAMYREVHTEASCHAEEKSMCGFRHPNHDCRYMVHRPNGASSLHQACDLRKREGGATVMQKVCEAVIQSPAEPKILTSDGLSCYGEEGNYLAADATLAPTNAPSTEACHPKEASTASCSHTTEYHCTEDAECVWGERATAVTE